MKTTEYVADSAAHTSSFSVERWRLRDASAIVRASRISELSLSAPGGTSVSHGIVPLAAGFAFGDLWGQRTPGPADEFVVGYRRHARVTVKYHGHLAHIGDTVFLQTHMDDATLSTEIRIQDDTAIATIEQSLRPERLVDEKVAESELLADSQGHTEEFTRVRVARWVYVAGESSSACGNHVAATSAGLPAAPVPGSLLMAIAERALFSNRVPEGELVAEFGVPVFAGDHATIDVGGDSLVLRAGRGIALEATVR